MFNRIAVVTLAVCLVTTGFAPAVAATDGPVAQSSPSADATAPAVDGLPSTAVATEDVAGGPTVAQTSDNDTRTITLLTYNDIQTAAAGNENRTLSRMVELIHQRRQATTNPTFVAGAGDQIGPHALSTLEGPTPPIHVLNATNPDADVIGNHEFDYADPEDNFSSIEEVADESTFPWLLANVVRTDNRQVTMPGTENYTIAERGGVRVGYVGLIDEGAANGKTSGLVDDAGYDVLDPATTGERVASRLKSEEDVDVVVALTHTGVPDSRDIANETESIDVIATGDDEILYPPEETNGVIVSEAKARALHVSEINLTVDTTTNDVVAWEGRMLDVTTDVPRNDTAAAIVDTFRGRYGFDEVLADSEVRLDARFDTNYRESSTFGNLATNGFRYVTDADVAATNPGGIRNDRTYGPGEITRGDVKASLPFPNTVVVKRISGAELVAFLNSTTSTTSDFFGAQFGQQTAGITYEMVPHSEANAEGRIRDVYVDGEPIDEDREYTIATNSYQAGDNPVLAAQPVVRNYENLTYAEAAAQYAQNLGTITERDVAPEQLGRTRRVDREVGAANVDFGGTTAVVTFQAPETATAVSGDVYLRNRSAGRIEAEAVALSNGKVTVEFDTEAFNRTADDASGLDVYAEYDDSAEGYTYDGRYANFDHAIMNAEVDESVIEMVDVPEPAANPFAGGVPGVGDAAPTDPDGDSQFEDVDGDGEVTFLDVVALFDALSALEGANARQQDAMDFQADGQVTFLDVVALLDET
jgi:2',3'-cyclic-nucleotide 2'-phosphodiesterase (5'-nucleotidase family)